MAGRRPPIVNEKVQVLLAKPAKFSGLEGPTANALSTSRVPYSFLTVRLKIYAVWGKAAYVPKFTFGEGTSIVIETVDVFTTENRLIYLDVKLQYPEIDIRFIFPDPNRCFRGQKTTYAKWCEQHGFKYSGQTVPEEWIKEIKNQQMQKKKSYGKRVFCAICGSSDGRVVYPDGEEVCFVCKPFLDRFFKGSEPSSSPQAKYFRSYKWWQHSLLDEDARYHR